MAKFPDYVVPPGDFIKEWMEEKGVSAAELARRLGVSSKHVSELLRGRAPLSYAVALNLENVTGVPARIWNLHEVGYREAIARHRADEVLADQYDQAKAFPLKYLRDHRYITADAKDKVNTVRGLLDFFKVASLEAFSSTWKQGAVAYRRSAVSRDNSPKLAVWLHAAELNLDEVETPPYDRSRLEDVLPTLRSLTVEEPTSAFLSAQRLLRECGVTLAIVPAVPGLGIHGATRWFERRPLIQLSGLFKSDDQLWFTLFHEIGHVLLHDPQGLYLTDAEDEMENEADEYAARLLVPQEYLSRLPRGRDLGAVKKLATELSVAPSIVLGQAQRRTGDYAWGQRLKRKVDPAAFTVEARTESNDGKNE